jgi:Tol biopolymer transport system component
MSRLFGWIAGVVVLCSTWAGATEIQLTTAGPDQRPGWSPDGSKIVLDSNRSGIRDLWRIPFNGGTATQITTGLTIDQHGDWTRGSSGSAWA